MSQNMHYSPSTNCTVKHANTTSWHDITVQAYAEKIRWNHIWAVFKQPFYENKIQKGPFNKTHYPHRTCMPTKCKDWEPYGTIVCMGTNASSVLPSHVTLSVQPLAMCRVLNGIDMNAYHCILVSQASDFVGFRKLGSLLGYTME